MADINLNPETPSQGIVKAANATVTVTDANGRQITIKKLNALDRMRLAAVVGAENVNNDVYFGYASLAYHVVAIADGEDVLRPVNRVQLEALVQRLDDPGMAAVGKGISENFLDPAQAGTDARDEIKK